MKDFLPDYVLIAVRKTGNYRLLETCDPDHPDYDPSQLRFCEMIFLANLPDPEEPKPPGRAVIQEPPRPACDYRDNCGCALPVCLHFDRGPMMGQPEVQELATVYRVSHAACLECGGVIKE